MKVLSVKYPGIFFVCQNCSALLAEVEPHEIYEDNAVYCMVCHYKNTLPFSKKYDGVVKEEKSDG